MKNGKEFLLTDTVGFIQKLPTTLVRKIPLLQFILLWVVYNWYLVLFFDIIYGKYLHVAIFSALCRLLPSEPHWRRYQSHHFWCMWLISGYISVEVLGVILFIEKRNLKELDNFWCWFTTYLINYFHELQSPPGRPTDKCCGQSSVRTRCIINPNADGLEQGILKMVLLVFLYTTIAVCPSSFITNSFFNFFIVSFNEQYHDILFFFCWEISWYPC